MRWVLLLATALLAGCSGNSVDAGPEEPVASTTDARPEEQGLNETSLTQSYAGPAIVFYSLNTGCGLMDPGGPAVGGTCFQIENGTERLHFVAKDTISSNVGLYVRYPEGGSEGYFCNSGTVNPSDNTTIIEFVVVDVTCALQASPATPTTGEITITMLHR